MATQVAPTPVTTEHKRAVRIREQLPYVGARLLSSDRYVLTVASHTPREMMCPQCGTTSLFARYCYQAAGYAYAIEGQ